MKGPDSRRRTTELEARVFRVATNYGGGIGLLTDARSPRVGDAPVDASRQGGRDEDHPARDRRLAVGAKGNRRGDRARGSTRRAAPDRVRLECARVRLRLRAGAVRAGAGRSAARRCYACGRGGRRGGEGRRCPCDLGDPPRLCGRRDLRSGSRRGSRHDRARRARMGRREADPLRERLDRRAPSRFVPGSRRSRRARGARAGRVVGAGTARSAG